MVMYQSKENYVPFVSEVEEFNATMGKPNNYKPTIPSKDEWMFVYNFIPSMHPHSSLRYSLRLSQPQS